LGGGRPPFPQPPGINNARGGGVFRFSVFLLLFSGENIEIFVTGFIVKTLKNPNFLLQGFTVKIFYFVRNACRLLFNNKYFIKIMFF
jgi:hypothetical protein